MRYIFLLWLAIVAVAAKQPPSAASASPTGDATTRIAALETKVEALSSDLKNLQTKIDSLITQTHDLNTKMNLVLLVGSVLFGALTTQMAGAFSKKAYSGKDLQLASEATGAPPAAMRKMAESVLRDNFRS